MLQFKQFFFRFPLKNNYHYEKNTPYYSRVDLQTPTIYKYIYFVICYAQSQCQYQIDRVSPLPCYLSTFSVGNAILKVWRTTIPTNNQKYK